MARKKDNDLAGGALMIIIFVLVFVAMFIAAITPIIIIFGFLINYGRSEEIKKEIKGDYSDFWLSDDEKCDFKNTHKEYSNVKDIIVNANNRAINAGVTRNQDGRYSARSKVGKEVRAIFERYEEPLNNLTQKFDKIRTLPLQRWTDFDNSIKKYKAYGYSALAYIILIIGYGLYIGKSSFADMYSPYKKVVNNLIATFTDSYTNIPLLEGEGMLLTIATIGAFIIFFSIYKLLPDQASAFSPEPPVVDSNNLDNY